MLIFNETLLAFKKRLLIKAKSILKNECLVSVGRTRFKIQGYTYPLQIVIFEHPNKLGYFEYDSLLIGINRDLLFVQDQKIVDNILRHELAHYLLVILHGHQDQVHGKKYRHLCQTYGWGKEVYSAKIDRNELLRPEVVDQKTKLLMEKVKKLLKLGSSNNSHEAKLATEKANELLLKYNLQKAQTKIEEEDYYLKSAFSQKRRSTKLEVLYDIVSGFFVKPVISYTKNEVRLDLFGTKSNIEFAEYVVSFLNFELERLWEKAKKELGYRGIRQKNSFFKGIAQGFLNQSSSCEKALIVKNLETQFDTFISKKSSSGSQARLDNSALLSGHKIGQTLTINPAIKNQGITKLLE